MTSAATDDSVPPPSYDSLDHSKDVVLTVGDVNGDNHAPARPSAPTSAATQNSAIGASDAPPDYVSLFPTQVQRALRAARVDPRQDGDDTEGRGCAKRSMTCVYNAIILPILFTSTVLMLFMLTLGLPISQLIMGAKYLGECTIESNIPIYLLVAGIFQLLELLGRCLKKQDDDSDESSGCRFDPVLVFILAWFVVGTVWVYGNYDQYESERYIAMDAGNLSNVTVDWENSTNDTVQVENRNYCDPSLMKFAFFAVTFHWSCVGFIIVGFIVLAVYLIVKRS